VRLQAQARARDSVQEPASVPVQAREAPEQAVVAPLASAQAQVLAPGPGLARGPVRAQVAVLRRP